MKIQNKTISALILSSILLSGCTAETAHTNSDLTSSGLNESITASETAISSETNLSGSAAVTETAGSAETEKAADTVSKTVTSENKTETDRYKENTYAAEFPSADIDMREYGGSFYQWKYDTSTVSENAADFPENELEAARREAEGYFIKLLEGAEKEGSENYEAIIKLNIPGYDREWDYGINDYEKCMSGDCGFKFEKGVRMDFDGDGGEESFFMFKKQPDLNIPIILTVFVDAKGEARALEGAELLSGELNPVSYNGFTHMAVSGGYNNSTAYTAIYAVENGEAVRKLTEFSLPENFNDVFMRVHMVQAAGHWLVFWNDEINEYCSLSGDPITDGEAEELFKAYSKKYFSDDEFYGRFKTAETLKNNTRKFGNVYCIAYAEYNNYHFFEKNENGFEASENLIRPADKEFTEFYADGIDFDAAAEKTVYID